MTGASQCSSDGSSDRARAYVLHGEPEIYEPPVCDLLQPMEFWTYHNLKGFERDARFLFYLPRQGSDYVLWQPFSNARDGLYDLFSRMVVATTSTKDEAMQRVFDRRVPERHQLLFGPLRPERDRGCGRQRPS